MFYGPALAFDAAQRACDLVFQAGALVMDTTPATALLIAVGTDGRAEADDVLPDGTTEGTLAAGLGARRGWAGDRLAARGARIGSRLWLLARAKLGDPTPGSGAADTLLLAEDYAGQATADFPARFGVDVSVAASRAAPNAMLLQVQAAGRVLAVRQTVG